MALFNNREARSISYQQVWGSGGDWQKALGSVGLLDAVTIPVVYRSLSILAGMVAQMDPRTYRGKGADRRELDDPPFIVSPSNAFTAYEWRFAGTVSLALAGEQTGMILGRDAADYPTTVEWVWPERMKATDRGLGLKPDWSLDGVPVSRDNVWHRRNFIMPGQIRGVDPLSRSGLLETAKIARKFGRDWFEKGAIPSGILETEADPGPEGAVRLLEKFTQAAKGRKPVVMPKNTKFTAVQVSADESQFLATVADAEASITTALGVPGEWVGRVASGSSVTYANRDQRLQDLQVATLNHYITVWNEALSASIPGQRYVRLNPAAVLRSDLASRMAAYSASAEIEAKTGIRVYTEDEMRDFEDRVPLPARTTPYSGQPNAAPPMSRGADL
jgi:HK97 family phage portal protein